MIRFIRFPTKAREEFASDYVMGVMAKGRIFQWFIVLQAGQFGLDHALSSDRPRSDLTNKQRIIKKKCLQGRFRMATALHNYG